MNNSSKSNSSISSDLFIPFAQPLKELPRFQDFCLRPREPAPFTFSSQAQRSKTQKKEYKIQKSKSKVKDVTNKGASKKTKKGRKQSP